MGRRSTHYEVCTDRSDGRKYTTLPPVSNGNGKTYRKIWLRTKCAQTAALRIQLLASIGLDDFKPLLRLICGYAQGRWRADYPFSFTEQWREYGVWTIEDERRLIDFYSDAYNWRADDRDNILNQDDNGNFIAGIDRKGNPIIDNVPQTVEMLRAIGNDQALTEYAKLLRPYLPDDHAPDKPKPCRERLSDCRDEWQEWQTLKKHTTVYVNATVNVFGEFIALVGNLPCNQLSKALFNRWKKHLMMARNGQGPKWYNDHLRPISAVLNHAKTETDFPLPDGLRDWIDFKYERYLPNKSNRQPMPADRPLKAFVCLPPPPKPTQQFAAPPVDTSKSLQEDS